jgi:hypothetical protein
MSLRTSDILKKLQLIDTSDRIIKKHDRVEYRCECGNIGIDNFQSLKNRLKAGKILCKKCAGRKSYRSSEALSHKDEVFLKDLGLVDTKARVVKFTDMVNVSCSSCQRIESVLFKNLYYYYKRKSTQWKCRGCRSRKNMSGMFYTTEQLAELGLVATNARSIKARDRAEVICVTCGVHGFPEFQNIKYKHKGSWHCGPCKNKMLNDAGTHIGASRAELEIKEWLQSFGLECHKKRFDGFEVDILINSLNIGIEHHGLYWHSEANRSKDYHVQKMKCCNKHGIRLIQIFAHEWRESEFQIKSFLKSALRLNNLRIGARTCDMRELSFGEARDFVDKYHIQGFPKWSVLNLGLFHEDQLVAVAVFGKHHRKQDIMVLSRFVCMDGVTVSGALSKMSKYASQKLKTDLVSWCDLRWSEGSGYLAAGWQQDEVLPPDYFYTNGGTNVFSKQSRMKTKVYTPDGMTEAEHAKKDGLFRVWDCGKIRFVYKYKAVERK